MASGTLIGTTLSVLKSLQGTTSMPQLVGDTILALEDTELTNTYFFERNLESLFQSKAFKNVVGVLIGRFQKKSQVSRPQLERVVQRSASLRALPTISNVDFGHTDPTVTLPIGGRITIQAGTTTNVRIEEH